MAVIVLFLFYYNRLYIISNQAFNFCLIINIIDKNIFLYSELLQVLKNKSIG